MTILLRNLGLIGANTVTAVLYGRKLGRESRCHFNQYMGWCSVYTASGDGYSAEYYRQNCMKLQEWTGQVPMWFLNITMPFMLTLSLHHIEGGFYDLYGKCK